MVECMTALCTVWKLVSTLCWAPCSLQLDWSVPCLAQGHFSDECVCKEEGEWASKRLLTFQIPCRTIPFSLMGMALPKPEKRPEWSHLQVLMDNRAAFIWLCQCWWWMSFLRFTESVCQRNAVLSSSHEWVWGVVFFLYTVVLTSAIVLLISTFLGECPIHNGVKAKCL